MPCCRVSIIIPVFNSAATLRRAAASALAQSLRDIEVLIVDDGSSDESRVIAEDVVQGDRRARLIVLPCNGGKSHAMNRAMSEAHGTWIAVLDADDEYLPGRLATMVAAGEAADVDLIADNQLFYDAGAGRIVGAAMPEAGGSRELTRQAFIAGCDPYAGFDLGMLKPVVRTEFLRGIGLRYRESARLSEDFLFLAEFLAAGGRALLLDRPFYIWTQAFGTFSRRWTETAGGAWRYDFASAVRAHTEVQREFAARGERDLAVLLARRARVFRRLMWLSEVSRRRRSGAALTAVVVLARHPSVWPELTRRAWRMLRAWRRGVVPANRIKAARRDLATEGVLGLRR